VQVVWRLVQHRVILSHKLSAYALRIRLVHYRQLSRIGAIHATIKVLGYVNNQIYNRERQHIDGWLYIILFILKIAMAVLQKMTEPIDYPKK